MWGRLTKFSERIDEISNIPDLLQYLIIMPLWSIGEWRAHIGSSWCALGRRFKTRSPFRGGGGGRVLRALTQSDVVTMIIMLMVFIGINFGLRSLVMNGYHHSLESE
jgi:hypothetical protein